MLAKVKTGECYTEPQTVYDVCCERGMDLVTITDHDSIRGALEIAHLPRTFLSEEITAVFPNDGTDVHVVALDITEAQHNEIQRLRSNIIELSHYLREAEIPHYVAHALSSENLPLRPEHLEQLFLLFKHFEGINGMRHRTLGRGLARIFNKMDLKYLERLAEKHHIEPVDWSTVRYLTAGSDDHGRLSIARAWTEFDAPTADVMGMREAFFNGRITMGGKPGSADTLSHNIYYVTLQYFTNTDSQSAFSSFLDDDDDEADADTRDPVVRRRQVLMGAVEKELQGELDLSITDIFEHSHKDEVQAALGRVGRGIIHSTLTHFFNELVRGVKDIDLNRAIDSLPGILTGGSVLLPYLFGYRYYVRDRDACEQLVADLGFGYPEEVKPKIPIFTDTGFDVNGVTIGLRRLISNMRAAGHDVELVVCCTPPEDRGSEWQKQGEDVKVFKPISEFPIPAYNEMILGVPSLIDIMEYLASNRIPVVQLSTPGPLGLVAGLAAKLMGIPIVANFHTELPKFVERIIGDRNVTAIVRHWTGWFYRQADRVIVPSKAAAQSLVEMGVDQTRIHVLPRGVDQGMFNQGKRDLNYWPKVGLNGAPKILYVGRVSKEKGLDTLFDAYERLKKRGSNAELVIVGDGPYLETLEQKHVDPSIKFLRYLNGDRLARAYASADIFVFPSANDTFGNAVLEAQASGLPVVVTDKGGPAEQVIPGVHGFIAPAGDDKAFAEAVQCLLDRPDLRTSMGRSGRLRAQSMPWSYAAEAQWRFYMEVWGRPDGSLANAKGTGRAEGKSAAEESERIWTTESQIKNGVDWRRRGLVS